MTNAGFRIIWAIRPRRFAAMACLAGVVLLATVESAAAAEWKTLSPEGEGFTCQMPGEAKPLTQKVETAAGPLEVVLYIVELADSAYLVNSTKIPANAIEATTEERLDGARDGAVANSKGKLVEEQKITVQGNPGRQLLIEQPGGLCTQLKVMMVHDRLIQLLVVTKSDRESAQKVFKLLTAEDDAGKKETPSDIKKFFDSFKLVKR